MEGYKVIKGFGSAEKGDVFTKVNDIDAWECIKTEKQDNYESCATMTFCDNTMQSLVKAGYVEWFDEAEGICACDKLAQVSKYIDSLIDTYTNDYNDLMKEYEEGNIQPCVKVEAETVYHNLNKVLNSIKNRLDE